ncbi:MAG TPA: hypothetical protein VGG12_03815 [Methylovirgula sp.]
MTDHPLKWGLAMVLAAATIALSGVEAKAGQPIKGFVPVPVEGIGVPGFQPVEGTSPAPRADAEPTDPNGTKAPLERQADGNSQKHS